MHRQSKHDLTSFRLDRDRKKMVGIKAAGETITCFDLFFSFIYLFFCPPLTAVPPPPYLRHLWNAAASFVFFFPFYFLSISCLPQHRAFEISDQTRCKRTPPSPPNVPIGGLLQCLGERREHFLEVCALLTTRLLLSFFFSPFPHFLSIVIKVEMLRCQLFFFLSPLMLWELTALSTVACAACCTSSLLPSN